MRPKQQRKKAILPTVDIFILLSSQAEIKYVCVIKKNGLLFCLKIQSFNCQTIVISLPLHGAFCQNPQLSLADDTIPRQTTVKLFSLSFFQSLQIIYNRY